jgi:hypothetical protein
MLGVGYGSAMVITMLGLRRLGGYHLLLRQLLLPFYWVLIGVATIRAVCDLLLRPFYWFKSPHQPATGPTRNAHDLSGTLDARPVPGT